MEWQQIQNGCVAKVGCDILVTPLHDMSRSQVYRNDTEKISMAVARMTRTDLLYMWPTVAQVMTQQKAAASASLISDKFVWGTPFPSKWPAPQLLYGK